MTMEGMRSKSTKEGSRVKLNIYKQKVEQAIKSYEKCLNKIVWQALSQEEKQKLDANKPIRYLENKTALNKALERLNWPISLKELSMLENEILAGKMYIQQAMELQGAAKKSYISKSLVEVGKPQGNPTKKTKPKKVDPLKGQKVIARCDENGFYFPGIVKKCLNPTHALVGFKYGDTKVVPTSFITPIGGAMPCPLLQVGDYVFAKIVIPKGFDFYVPAIVTALPNPDSNSEKFYTVLKCNNRREFCPRSALIKISQNKYALSCSHIISPPLQENPKGDCPSLPLSLRKHPCNFSQEISSRTGENSPHLASSVLLSSLGRGLLSLAASPGVLFT
uniref:DUF4537 domain-containing protein n=1 Tax=Marmota marmota marmota TaxID=9994 RepID=A0A8C6A4I9_MARMA